MDKIKRYQGILIIVIAVVLLFGGAYALLKPLYMAKTEAEATVEQKSTERKNLLTKKKTLDDKIERSRNTSMSANKRVYAPVESDLGDDTLFFNLYSDLLEMLKVNSIRIKSISYVHNPEDDVFVQRGNGKYFVFNIDMELVSNYENLGKLIENIYSYPYYIKINNVDVRPYEKDRKILNTQMSLRLYSKTTPDEDVIPVAQ